MISHQVVIVGGGPAGSACARRLGEAGVDCLIVDKMDFPRQKTCAGWLTPSVFKMLGVKPADYPYDLTVFSRLLIYLKGFPIVRPGKQYAIRRLEFDGWLLDLSEADFIQHEVKEIQRTEKGFLLDGQIEAQVLVGAGGTHCPVARMFREDSGSRASNRIVALESEYQIRWHDPLCRLWFLENELPGYSWYVPKTGGYLNLGVGGNAAALKETQLTIQDQWEYLVEKLQQSGLISEIPPDPRGYVYYLRGSELNVSQKDLYLVGDAAGLATRDMGEGIGPAIHSGMLAAEAIISGRPYQLNQVSQYSLLPPGLRWLVK
ncbi:MAG: NAD(P)/FAD-dependent oxidoreductase [Anaerolineales bacterium]